MKPRIRKKDKGVKGNKRYVLEYLEEGKIKTLTLNPKKILDLIKKSKIRGGNP